MAKIDSALDQLPPVIILSAPKEALPGAAVMVTADVSDNVDVASVQFQLDQGSPVPSAGPPYQYAFNVSDVVTPGTSMQVRATARDSAGNVADASVSIKVVAEPDTQKPTITLNVSPQAAPGSSLLMTATASDNVGIDSVGFAVNGTAIGSASIRWMDTKPAL